MRPAAPGAAAAAAGHAVLRLDGPAELGRLYPWLQAAAQALGVPPEMRPGLHVALEEAAANAALHAYAGAGACPVAVWLEPRPGGVALVLEDAGRDIDPTALPLPATGGVGGAGLRLLRHYCRDIRHERLGTLNRLTLRFPLPAAPRP